MKSISEVKRLAFQELKTNYSSIILLMLPTLILSIFMGGLNYSTNPQYDLVTNTTYYNINPFIGLCGVLVLSFISSILDLGTMEGILNKEYSISQAFKYFKSPDFEMSLKVIGLVFLYTILWFFIPIAGPFIAMVKSFSYAIAPILIIKKENFNKADDYITRSRQIMDGHKMDYFIFGLSFIGWIILIFFTLGLASFFVLPYIAVADAYYLNEIYENKK